MPHGSVEVVGNTFLVRENASLAADRGHIVQATARQWPIIAVSTMTWTEIWLLIGSNGIDSRVALLASGYVANNYSISWTGRIPLEPDMRVQISVYNTNQSTIKLHVTTDVEG